MHLAEGCFEMAPIQLVHAQLGLVQGEEVDVWRQTLSRQPENLKDLRKLVEVPMRIGAALRRSQEKLKSNIETRLS